MILEPKKKNPVKITVYLTGCKESKIIFNVSEVDAI